ncbi:MAG: HD domain-containing protein [Kiritimatiellae bacterium]|nr:HD domain-containing protein [Kiritimatiellia bacterium]
MTAEEKKDKTQPAAEARPPRLVAVIDIGSTGVRLSIAEIDESGGVRELEFLQQAVSLGRDVFVRGTIEKATIEECVSALQSFRRVLEEYHITRDSQVRAVATSAVREAANQDAFADRIYMATGIQVEPIEEADVTRLTYLSVRAALRADPALAQADALVTEVGGGSTELLLLREGNVVFSQTYRLGSFRMREMLEVFSAPVTRHRRIMETNINRTIEQIQHGLALGKSANMIALGGDVRFAAARLLPGQTHPVRLPLPALSRFADEVLALPVNDIVRKHHMPFPEAETLGPALLIYVRLARAFGLRHIVVTDATMRHGLLTEMAARGVWSGDFAAQIIRSARELARKYAADEKHIEHVAELCGKLFQALADQHRLPPRFGLILRVAALLHDIGQFVSPRSHHKHSLYLIQNSELFGLGRHDHLLAALVARYHRRASPKPTHEGYPALDRDSRLAVMKLAAILRVAEALDRSHSQQVRDIRFIQEPERLVIEVARVADLSLEQLALQQKGSLFEDVYGMDVVLRKRRSRRG